MSITTQNPFRKCILVESNTQAHLQRIHTGRMKLFYCHFSKNTKRIWACTKPYPPPLFTAVALWAPAGTRRSLLTLRSRCRTGGPQSSPSRRAALGGRTDRGKGRRKSLQALLWHYMDNWTHAMRRGVLTGSFTACSPTHGEQEACFYLSLCV